MNMNTVEDMNKILAILDKAAEKRKTAYMALPRLSRSAEEHRRLGQDTDAYVELIEREKAITDRYFNVLQKQEWATSHKRWIETGYSTYQLSDIGKEILNGYLDKVIEEQWWEENQDRLTAEFESSKQYLGDDDRNFEWYINQQYETYLSNF